jgi:predicted nuclease of restriction endonuclease-like RecB superfamily
LRAECVVEGRRLTLALGTGDRSFRRGAAPLRQPIEERFARDFRRVAPDWDVVREPERAGRNTLIFPDFTPPP